MPGQVIVVDNANIPNDQLAEAKRNGDVIVYQPPGGGPGYIATGPGQFAPMTPEVKALMDAPAPAPTPTPTPPPGAPPGAPPPGAPPPGAGLGANLEGRNLQQRGAELERAGVESDVQGLMAEEARRAADPLGAFGIADRAKIDAIMKSNPGMTPPEAIKIFQSQGSAPAMPPPPDAGKAISGGPGVMGRPMGMGPGMGGGLPRPPRMG